MSANNKKSRRSFLESIGIGSSAIVASPWIEFAKAAESGAPPELIVINAKVTTMDDQRPRAEAFAVKEGHFTIVGSTEEVKALAGPKTRTYDAKKAMIVPTFNDTHNHGGGDILLYDVLVGNPFVVEYVTIQSVIDKLKARGANTPAGYWVEGFYFDDAKVKDNQPLTRQDLDKVSTVHPVVVYHRGGHTSYYNSKAFEMAGVTKDTPPPFGGTFDKDASGELNGRVTDNARTVFSNIGRRIKYTPTQELQRKIAGVELISKKFVQFGLGNVCHHEDVFDAMRTVRSRGNLLHRVSFEPGPSMVEAMIRNGVKSGTGDEWIKLGATAEHSVDGSFSERTAAMSRPYIGITPPYSGNVTEAQENTNEWAEHCHRAGIRPNIHANGDVAIAQALTAYEGMLKKYPASNARPKITHCTFVNQDLIRRIKAINVVPALFSTYAYYNSDKFHYYGAEFMKNAMAYKSLADAGVKASTGSDFGTPGPFDPMMAIQGMVTRKGYNGETWGENQKVTVDQAIRASTYNGAYNTLEENIKGSITPGKLADWVVLSENLYTIDPDKIINVRVVQTVVGGVVRYQA